MDGTSLDQGFPAKLDEKSVAWRTELPGQGHASPIVWDDRLFTVALLPEKEERVLLCVDRSNGKLLWQKAVLKAAPEDRAGNMATYADPSLPLADDLVRRIRQFVKDND